MADFRGLLFLFLLGFALCRAEEGTCEFDSASDSPSAASPAEERLFLTEKRLSESVSKLSELEEIVRVQGAQIENLEHRLQQTLSLNAFQGKAEVKPAPANEIQNRGYEIQPYGASHSKTLLRHRNAFYDAFKLLSVVKTDGELTALTSKPSTEDRRNSDFFLLGDALGKLYVFSPHGDLLSEYSTGSESPVIDLSHYHVSANMTGIATCHSNGDILLHLMSSSTKERDDSRSAMRIEKIEFNATLSWNISSDPPPVAIFATKSDSRVSFTGVAGENGRVLLLRANGTILRDMALPSRILDIRTDKHYLTIGHKEGVSLYNRGRIKHLNCSVEEKLELQAVAFDVDRTSRAFGITAKNELVTFTINTEESICKARQIRHRKPLRLTGHQMKLQSVKGYLMITSTHGFSVMNVTLAMKRGPRDVVVEPLAYISEAFGFQVDSVEKPLLSVTPRGDVYMALHLSEGVLAIFESHLFTLPVTEIFPLEGMYRPVFFLALAIVVMWRFWNRGRGQHRYDPGFDGGDIRRRRDARRMY